MKQVSILVPETAVPAAVVDPSYMFNAVNEFYKSSGHQPFFQVQLVAHAPEVALNGGTVTIKPDKLLSEVVKTDLIIVPAISGDMAQSVKLNEVYRDWIINQYKQGAEVASLCVGAFLLASTGLLDGKTCSTHWLFANDFKQQFPQVKLSDDRVITEQNGIYSSGGASSYWNLLLYLVEKYTSKEMAIMASKFFLLDTAKASQLPFSIFKGQKLHGDELILDVQSFLEDNYQLKLSIDDLSEKYAIGRRTFERRFKKATSNTIIEYIQRIRVEAAKKQMETGYKNVSEIMYEVGYTDPKAFREVFKKYCGMSPAEYKDKFRV
ncbi:MAG: helix-turn-helix domain-containing protein [Bacteroidetes bacterium]|nr:helix-turn-helix domain-containing protein [Bacteroidota bacterium]